MARLFIYCWQGMQSLLGLDRHGKAVVLSPATFRAGVLLGLYHQSLVSLPGFILVVIHGALPGVILGAILGAIPKRHFRPHSRVSNLGSADPYSFILTR